MSASDLKDQIQADMKDAMRARDQARLGTIRLVMAAIKQREIDEQITLDDAAVLTVINKMIKQRRDAISQFEQGGRSDLAEKEQLEIETLQDYLPEQLSEAEIEQAVQAAIQATSASSVKDMGKVMGILKEQLAGKADMGMVSGKVKSLLS